VEQVRTLAAVHGPSVVRILAANAALVDLDDAEA
jgi:hypothetical protein